MNTTLLPKSVVPSVTLGILSDRPWSGPAIGKPILRKHTRILARMYRKDNFWTRRLREACKLLIPLVERGTPLLTQVDRGTLNTIPVLLRLAEYRDQWIREPESWKPDLQLDPRQLLISLIHHLVLEYEIPKFCDGAWFINGPIRHIERDWFCHLAQGGNIRKFPGWVPPMTKRAASLFLIVPESFSMREAIRYGQVLAIGISISDAIAITSSRIGLDFSYDSIYLPMLEMWAATQREMLELEIVSDYIWARCHLYGPQSIQFKGRTWASLVNSARNFFLEGIKVTGLDYLVPSDIDCSYWRNLTLRALADSWNPMVEVKPFEKVSEGWFWKMVEITSQRELDEEGSDMDHCVSEYSGACQRGEISIFSLRSRRQSDSELDRDVTVEVWRKKRKVLQVKAWRNRRPHRSTRRMVMQWCKENDIDPGAYSRW